MPKATFFELGVYVIAFFAIFKMLKHFNSEL